jgi:PAP2 superfamily
MHVITTRWNWNRCVAAGTAAFLGALGWSNAARADAVTDWHEIAENTLCTASPMARGPSTLIDIAIVHTAVYDAVQNIGGKYKPYHTQISGASGSPEAAVAKAAHDTLANLFPTKAQDLGTTYKEYLAKKGLKEDDPGVAAGQKAAAGILALRADDGRAGPNPAAAALIGENAVGKWRTTPPQTGYYDQMRAAWMGAAKPFVIQSGSQFRANPPPDLKSDQYAKDYNEVKAVGAATNSTRTPEQTELANFYRSEYLCPIFQQIPREIAKAQTKSIDDSSRLLALVSMAVADNAITVWDSKKHFQLWRPITAIQEGENDGNPATAGDPSWQPFLTTPPYSDYTSGANGVSGATTGILKLYFGKDDVPFTVTSPSKEAKEKTRNYKSFSEYATDMVNVRIYQGVHFRSADEAARDQGMKVAAEVFKKVGTPK